MPRHVLFLRLAYQAGMCLLALVAVTLTAIDLTTEAAEWEVTADRIIGTETGVHLDWTSNHLNIIIH